MADSSITLDHLTALNDEISALIRSGVPLEQGLGQLGGDLPGRLGRAATRLSECMNRGQSLGEALEDPSIGMPTVYRAVVKAGVQAGRLPAALESVAQSSRRLTELRQVVIMAFVYPLLIGFMVWGLLALFTAQVAPNMLDAFRDFELFGQEPLAMLARWGESAHWWGPAGPVVVLVLAGAWCVLSSRASMLNSMVGHALWGWLPWTGRLLHSLRAAIVAEVLTTLVENEVPLGESILLAAETVGDQRTMHAAEDIAAALSRGEAVPPIREGGAFSPMLRWLIGAGKHRKTLASALRHAAETYRRAAVRQTELITLSLPVLLMLLIGGTGSLLYALLLFVPWISFLNGLVQL